jgi:hypothetical protein
MLRRGLQKGSVAGETGDKECGKRHEKENPACDNVEQDLVEGQFLLLGLKQKRVSRWTGGRKEEYIIINISSHKMPPIIVAPRFKC